MAGIDDVARLAGVSTATVSRALSGRGQVSPETRSRVEEAARVLGYVVSSTASSLASGRTRNVGVLVPHLDRWFFSAVVSGVASALMRRGYDLTLYSVDTEPVARRSVFDTFLRRRRVDAVIAVSIALGDPELSRLGELGIPVIAIGGPNPRLRSLTVDDVGVGRLATQHLLGLGHTEIAHIGASPPFDIDHHVPTQRRRGFEQALREAHVPIRAALFEPADFTIEGGFRAATRLLGRPGPAPTAIFAASDEMAIGAILAARELGRRVPDDLSVIGIDGHELGDFFRLTTVDQFPVGQGELAAAAVLAELDGTADVERPAGRLPYELVVRASTAAPPR
jgi:LacI family transcriptional regulator, repressor for deo operon, udp, cdd, tsx, nupC, and nupG